MDSSSLPGSLDPSSVLLDRKICPPNFVIRPFFPAGELTEIVGAHGAFKSTIALDACLSIAAGRPWGGRPTVKGRTAFITLEDSADTLARRVRAWLEGIHQNAELGHGGSEEAAAEQDVRRNFSFLARDKTQGLVLTRTADGATAARVDVAEHVARLTDGAALVVLETASRLHDGPETNDAFAALVRSLERIAATGTALVLVRHISKKGAQEVKKNPEDVDSYMGRGGAALSDAVRSSLAVTRQNRHGHDLVTLMATKTTHAQPGETISWTPLVVPGLEAVRLEVCSPEQQALDDADQLRAYIATREQGVTKKDLHDDPPPGLGRNRAKQALDNLVARGCLVVREEQRGRNKQPTDVYFAPRPGLEAA
jgi:hypothetical protein